MGRIQREWVWAGVLLAAVGSGFVITLAPPPLAAAPAPHLTPRRVVTALVAATTTSTTIPLAGQLRASQRAHLSFTVAGRMTERPVEVGQQIPQGALLAALDPLPFAHQVAATRAAEQEQRAQLQQAQLDLTRVERLREQGLNRAEELDQATTTVTARQAALERTRVERQEAERQQQEAQLYAPYAGVVTEVTLEPGEYAVPGAVVLTLSATDPLELRVEVPEQLLGSLFQGEEVAVGLPLAQRTLTGRVAQVGQAAAADRPYPVVITLTADPQIRPGMPAELHIPTPPRTALAVPTEAIQDPSGLHPFLWVVRHQQVEPVAVTVQGVSGETVLISGAVAEHELVVIAGHASLTAGVPVEVTP